MYLCPSKAKRRSHPRMTKADYKVQGRHTTLVHCPLGKRRHCEWCYPSVSCDVDWVLVQIAAGPAGHTFSSSVLGD